MIKGTVVLCLALVAVLLLRRRSAALRHRVLAAAIVCAALVPLAEPRVPAWHVPVFDARSVETAKPLALTGDETGTGEATAATTPHGGGVSQVLPSLRTVWGLGAGVSLLGLAIGLARLMRFARLARPVTDERWLAAAADLGERCGLGRPLALLQTTHPTLLFTWGLRRPRVLLPAGAGDWSDDRIRVVLGHELAHIHRGDWAVHLLAECVRSVYWFNPLAWVACHRLRLESEHACDDAVLRLGVAAPAYATELLDLARLFRRSRRALLPAPAMARPSDLERRIRIMLNPHLDRSPVGRVSAWFVVLTCVAVTATLSGLSLTAAAAPQAGPAGQAATTTPSPATLPAPVPATAPVPASAGVPSTAPTPRPAAAPARPAAAPVPQTGPTSGIVVTVVDQFQRLVPNAVVTLNCEAPQLNSEGRTGPDGQFTASGFVAGTYKVSVSKPGFKSARITMPIEPRQKAAPRVVLGLGAMREMIVVAAVTAASDVTSLPPSGPLIRSTTDAPVNDPCATSQEGGCVMAPRKLVDVKPIYPQSYAATGGTGTVVINARILTDGTAGDLKPQPGSDAVLSAAAMDAIRRWRFSPTHLDGVPVPVDMIVTVRFEISR